MRSRSLAALTGALVAAGIVAWCGAAPMAKAAAGQDAAAADASSAALLAEVKKSFTLNGKPIPPEIFRDFGDGDMADSGGIWVAVDLNAAVGSNLYYDAISNDHGWFSQKTRNTDEVTGYTYYGATDNGLLVVLASWNGGGSGTFYTLHILDLAAANAFDDDGKIYRRINLTLVRSIIMGDRWSGGVTITKNTVHIATEQRGPTGNGPTPPATVEAKRP
jgi:hypothetical protein